MKKVFSILALGFSFGLSGCGIGLCAQELECAALATPERVTSLNVRMAWKSAQLTWPTVASAHGYLVVRSQLVPSSWTPEDGAMYEAGATISPTEIVLYSGAQNSATDSGLTNGTSYFYRVYSFNQKYAYISGATSSGSPGIQIDAVSGGEATHLSVSTQFAVLSKGAGGIDVYSLANPDAPTLVGAKIISGGAFASRISGNFAFIAAGAQGLTVVDLSNPATPEAIATLDTDGSATSIELSASRAYLADGSGGLVVIDISDPNSPTLVSKTSVTGTATFVTLYGNRAYVIIENNGFRIVDITNPLAPSILGSALPGLSLNELLVYDDFDLMVVAGRDNLLTPVVEVGTPSAPVSLGDISFSSDVLAMAKGAGTELFVQSWMVGVERGDISGFSVTDTDYDGGGGAALAVQGNRLYTYNSYYGLATRDISGAMTTVHTVPSFGALRNVAPYGDRLVGADATSGLVVLEQLPSETFKVVGSYNTPGAEAHVAVQGSRAYLSAGITGLAVVDLTTPTAPSLLGTHNTPGSANFSIIDGNIAYVADGTQGVRVVDISNPASMPQLGFYDTLGTANGLAKVGTKLYVADGSNGLVILDVSTPATPTLVGGIDTAGITNAVEIRGNYAYLADGSNGLVLSDISSPTSPTLAGSYNSPGSALFVSLRGDYAVVNDGSAGVLIVNVAQPSAPTLEYTLDTPGLSSSLFPNGTDAAFAADSTAGLLVLHGLPPL